MLVSMRADWSDVLLDLLNTTPVVDGVGTDLLADDDAARRWLASHDGSGDECLDGVREVRDELQRVVRGDADPTVLDRYLLDVRQVPRIRGERLEWALGDSADWRARAVLAWGRVQDQRPGR